MVFRKSPARELRDFVLELIGDGLLGEAEYVASEIISDVERIEALGKLAAVYTKLGQFQRADLVIEHLRVESIQTDRNDFGYKYRVEETRVQRLLALCNLARAMSREESWRVAALLQEVRSSVSEIADKDERARVLHNLSIVESGGDWDTEGECGADNPIKERPVGTSNHLSAAMRVLYLAEPRPRVGDQDDEGVEELHNAGIDELIDKLVTAGPGFDQIEPGLGGLILRETVRIASWVRNDWRAVSELTRAARKST